MGLCKSSLPPLFTMSSTVRVEDLAPVYACRGWIPRFEKLTYVPGCSYFNYGKKIKTECWTRRSLQSLFILLPDNAFGLFLTCWKFTASLVGVSIRTADTWDEVQHVSLLRCCYWILHLLSQERFGWLKLMGWQFRAVQRHFRHRFSLSHQFNWKKTRIKKNPLARIWIKLSISWFSL